MYASLRYIDTRHPFLPIEGQPDFTGSTDAPSSDNVDGEVTANRATSQDPTGASAEQSQQIQVASEPARDTPQLFQQRLKELAQDLVAKGSQIEHLIDTLPGIGTSQRDQEARMKELETQLQEVEAERVEAALEKERLLERLDGQIMKMGGW